MLWAHPRSINQNIWGRGLGISIFKTSLLMTNMLPKLRTTDLDLQWQIWSIYANSSLPSSQNKFNSYRILCMISGLLHNASYIADIQHLFSRVNSWGSSRLVIPSVCVTISIYSFPWEANQKSSFQLFEFFSLFLVLSSLFSPSFPWYCIY